MPWLLGKRPRFIPKEFPRISPVFGAILAGCTMGGLAVATRGLSAKWETVILLAILAVPVVLLINDIKKFILIVLVIDIPLGVDIAIQNQGWHQGGPTGYMLSLTTIVLVIGYALWIIERKPRPHLFPTMTIPALLFLGMIALSFYQSTNWQLSGFGLFLQLQLFLMGFYLVNHVSSQAEINLIATTAAICLLLESALMILQYFTGVSISIGGLISSASLAGAGNAGATGARVSGTLARPGTAALYLNSMLTLTLGAYLSGTAVNKKLALVAMSLGVVALVATSSRAGWIALGLALLVMVARAAWTKSGAQAVVALLIGGSLLGLFLGGNIFRRLGTTGDDRTREELAFMAYNIIQAHPMGVGENTYDLYMSDKYAHPNWVGHTLYPPHNRYLITWAQLGLQGLIAFILLLVAPIWQARRWLFRNHPDLSLVALANGLLGALVANMVHMASETFNAGAPVQLLWFIIALLTATNAQIASAEIAPALERSDAPNIGLSPGALGAKER